MSQENVEVIRHGVLRNATAPYGKVLDVNHIIQSASFPLTEFKTTIKHEYTPPSVLRAPGT